MRQEAEEQGQCDCELVYGGTEDKTGRLRVMNFVPFAAWTWRSIPNPDHSVRNEMQLL
jgi:hypothetical protein